MIFKPTKQDLEQLSQMGLTPEAVQHQIDNFKAGFPKSQLDAAATPDNHGILCLSDKEITRYEKQYRSLARGKKILKFVPASGATTFSRRPSSPMRKPAFIAATTPMIPLDDVSGK